MELIYVTAQPDVPYFHWQAKIYGHNFVSKGIKPENIHIIYGLCNGQQEPSEGALELRNYGYNVHFYKDERFKKHYIPSIKPFLNLTKSLVSVEFKNAWRLASIPYTNPISACWF